ncbi:alpha/beta fold hydrolase [Fibrella arboris]|uniref:alpha/beta fold hydrolase n=1 Tax=Fibrella arboris TaxID=3242486 RepID=UPI0035229ADD
MKIVLPRFLLAVIAYIISCEVVLATRQPAIDTLIEVGSYTLHVKVISGKGTPILLEAGGGEAATVWTNLIQPLADITQAPVIVYDRMGLGSSSRSASPISIGQEVTGLATALNKLGFTGPLMLVTHSLGGFYSTLYAHRYPQQVKAMVFIDANLPCFFTEEHLQKIQASEEFRQTIQFMKQHPLPATIPVVDMVAEKTLFVGTPNDQRWKNCHLDFVSASPHRKYLLAYECGHYIFFSNRQLVLNTIVTLYAQQVEPTTKTALFERGYVQEQVASNENRRDLMRYWHSVNDLNEWGYSFLKQGEPAKAIEVFRLNVALHPDNANTYDSLGEAYLKANQKALAIENYQKSLQLNPKNENARKVLNSLEK